ncbi:HK97 family phage prohead protease [Sphingomonas pituitosa]|uniref:HK97 family phage prohead protease n=1 Tax=Sphingomonas pituitosa TaxID=99597 RepID=UPI00082C827D|nr:HK97 family phage prohead protease [Sphingomonas pituitosa]
MNELDFELDTKSIADDGTVEGLAIGYGNIDHGGDQVMPGAFSASLAGRKSLPMLLYHDQRRPAGVWNSWQETSDGLLVKGRFAMSTPTGKEAYGLTKDGAIGGLSMGFKTLKQRMEAKTRQLLQGVLHEISLVTIPMNDRTRVISVKDIGDLRDRLAAGERLTEREWEGLLKKSFDLSNAEAERAVRLNLKGGQGEPGGTASDQARSFFEALRS